MFKILVPAVAALGLVAFTAKTQDVSARVGPTMASAPVIGTSAPVMAWHLSREGETAKLAYGIENSDQLALMVTCAPGDRTAAIYGDVQPVSARLAPASNGPSPTDALSGGEADEMRLPLRDEALQGLARQGRMTVQSEGGVFAITATANERRAIGQFLGYCGTANA